MKILVADKLPESACTRLQGSGMQVVDDPSLADDSLRDALSTHQPNALIVRSTHVRASHFDAAPGLELVVRAGAGVNTIDLAAASSRGVFVANCPGMNAAAVAELTFAHILNADRRVSDNVAALRAGQWQKKTLGKARGVKGRTLGVLGCGAIGRAVIQRARAFEMPVVAWSPNLTDERAEALGVQRAESPIQVAQRADVLTVHLALSDSSRGLVSQAIFDALGSDAIFINTSRGELVDQTALKRAIEAGGLQAGLDVYADEPAADGPWDLDLARLDSVYGTHHIGASTEQAQHAVAAEACRVIERYRTTGVPPNCVNLAAETAATAMLVVRHADRVGVLAGVLDVLRQGAVNVQGMENIIFAGAQAACARIQVVGDITGALLSRLRSDDRIFAVRVVPLTPRSEPVQVR